MKTTIQEKKTNLRELGFTEIINLAVITGGGHGGLEKGTEKEDQLPG